jgi:hypothetical protein
MMTTLFRWYFKEPVSTEKMRTLSSHTFNIPLLEFDTNIPPHKWPNPVEKRHAIRACSRPICDMPCHPSRYPVKFEWLYRNIYFAPGPPEFWKKRENTDKKRYRHLSLLLPTYHDLGGRFAHSRNDTDDLGRKVTLLACSFASTRTPAATQDGLTATIGIEHH